MDQKIKFVPNPKKNFALDTCPGNSKEYTPLEKGKMTSNSKKNKEEDQSIHQVNDQSINQINQ